MAVNRYDGTRAWYAVSTYAGHEDKVADSINQRVGGAEMKGKIFEAIVPKEKQIEIKNGFPGVCIGRYEAVGRDMVYRQEHTWCNRIYWKRNAANASLRERNRED